ncbi:MAG: DUF4199 domain-containing protein [Flavobacteriaceae bacterium]|nr:DUF4199 domain-containing protein [Flavobacteriaceae bacterium]
MINKIVQSPVIKYGIIIGISLIGYFILLSFYDKHSTFAFSFFNSIIIGFGIYKAISEFKLDEGSRYSSSEGFKVGVFTGFFATVVHACFFTIYISKINLNFAENFLNDSFKPVLIDNNSAVYKAEFYSLIKSFIDFEIPAIVGFFGLLIVIIFGFSTSIILTYIFVKFIDRKAISKQLA